MLFASCMERIQQKIPELAEWYAGLTPSQKEALSEDKYKQFWRVLYDQQLDMNRGLGSHEEAFQRFKETEFYEQFLNGWTILRKQLEKEGTLPQLTRMEGDSLDDFQILSPLVALSELGSTTKQIELALYYSVLKGDDVREVSKQAKALNDTRKSSNAELRGAAARLRF